MENSKIEWTHHTFNSWVGCTKVSEGCKFCYAETLMDHRYGKVKWGPQGTRQRTSAAYWRQPLQWNKKAQADGKRYRVFCASLADVFEDRPELAEWRAELFTLIDQCDHLDWLLLTKRPGNVNRMVADAMADCEWLSWKGVTPRNNIWVGTSVENQEQVDKRIPHLLGVPAAVRFLSMEPLLGYTRLYQPHLDHKLINWVIVGGESGQNARPMHPAWARSLRDQCQAAGVPFFFKQWGEWLSQDHMADEQYGIVADLDTDYPGGVRRFKKSNHLMGGELFWNVGKKAAGRLLDGIEYSQFPV